MAIIALHHHHQDFDLLIKIALGTLVLVLLLLLLAQGCNRLLPVWTAGLYRSWLRKRAGLSESVQALQGFKTPYLHGGRGEVLVMLHDFAADKNRFFDVSRHLKDHTRLLIPELAGHGDADKRANSDYSIAAQVERLRAFVQAHNLSRFHIGGVGMGGSIAAWYTATYPNEIASVWLINANATQEAWQADWVKNYDATGYCPMVVKSLAEHRAKWKMVMGEDKYLPFCVLHSWAVAGARDFDLHHSILKTLRQTPPLESQYTGLQTPALILCGELDRLVPASSIKSLCKVFTRAQASVMQDLGHLPHLEAPDQIAQDYLAFRAKLEATVQHKHLAHLGA